MTFEQIKWITVVLFTLIGVYLSMVAAKLIIELIKEIKKAIELLKQKK